MTRFIHDQFAKDYLQELLEPIGRVEIPRRVTGEARQIDVWFEPANSPDANHISKLGLLGRFTNSMCIFEPFRNPATVEEICNSVLKYLEVRGEFAREANRNEEKLQENNLPRLWIISPTVSENILNGFGGVSDNKNWGPGIYFFHKYFRSAIVAIHQLPKTPDTLWLRMLGRGKVQRQAITELEALPEDDLLRLKALELFYELRNILEARQQSREQVEEEDKELIVRLKSLYQQTLEAARAEASQQGLQQGLQQGERIIIEQLLKTRFGSLDEELLGIIEPLLLLPPEEFTPLLLGLSRQELLERFCD
jgi:hypothetical protein